MYVCICHAVTDHEVIRSVHNGASSMKDLRKTLTIGTTCGRCVSGVKSLLKESLAGVDNTMTCKLTNNNIIHAPV